MLTHVMYNKSTAAALQVASELTIKKKDNFFAIAYPTLLSNFSRLFNKYSRSIF